MDGDRAFRAGRAMICVGCLCYLTASSSYGDLIVNGDFELGIHGFATEYRNNPVIPGAAEYAMTTNPQMTFPAVGQDYGDHTTGSGLMMMVNGSTVPDTLVWAQTVPVEPNALYEFSAWASIWGTGSGGTLDFQINGTSIGTFSSYPTAAWAEFSQTLNSGNNTALNIRIFDRSLGSAGNDFALDDISLVPEPAALGLVGFALMVCACDGRRRRKTIGRPGQ